jgi:beta-N-acetylhexosaminidase
MGRLIPTLIYDVQGLELNREEKSRLKHPASAGVILFQRNYQNIDQLLSLTRSILKENPRLFITVDQEGGRVQRFREAFTALPPMTYWGEQYAQNAKQAIERVTEIASRMAQELKRVHVAFSYAPVLDLNYQHNEVIGERSFHRDPEIVTALGDAFIQGLHREKMCAVGKHFPGHGFVTADSHVALPIDDRKKEVIENNDVVPFSKLSHKLDAVMPAHIVYSAIDAMPPCFSRRWLHKELREKLKFKGAIITDDLNMAAVRELMSVEDCVDQALIAGCDFLLICNNQKKADQMLTHLERCSIFDSNRKKRVDTFMSKARACIQ